MQTVMRDGDSPKLGNSFSEKQNQGLMRTKENENSVARESGVEHISDEEDWVSEDSHSSFLISCFAWH